MTKGWHWSVEFGGYIDSLVDANGDPVIEVDVGCDQEGLMTFEGLWVEKSARPLIEAAPNLLAACEQALDWLHGFGEHAPIEFGGEAELEAQLLAAIAKAKGDA
jgi:hypothetical protein